MEKGCSSVRAPACVVRQRRAQGPAIPPVEGSAPLHPTDGVNELISIEDDEKPFQGAHRVARTRRDCIL